MKQNNRSTEFSNHPNLTKDDVELLRERTANLAFKSKKESDLDDAVSERYLSMTYLDERYGIPLSDVSEAIALIDLVAVPGTPPHVVGLTRLRGQIIALVNLHIYWRKQIAGHGDCDRAVIVSVDEYDFGLVCNKIEGLKTIVQSTIEETPADLPMLTKTTIRGIADRNLLLLSPEKLIKAPGFLVR